MLNARIYWKITRVYWLGSSESGCHQKHCWVEFGHSACMRGRGGDSVLGITVLLLGTFRELEADPVNGDQREDLRHAYCLEIKQRTKGGWWHLCEKPNSGQPFLLPGCKWWNYLPAASGISFCWKTMRILLNGTLSMLFYIHEGGNKMPSLGCFSSLYIW